MLNQSGVINDIPWSVDQIGARKFLLKVGDMEEEYDCVYPALFGIDFQDVNAINEQLDIMQIAAEEEKHNV